MSSFVQKSFSFVRGGMGLGRFAAWDGNETPSGAFCWNHRKGLHAWGKKGFNGRIRTLR